MTLYYSVRTRHALTRQFSQLPLGLPHYSYGIVSQKFITLLADMGIGTVELPMPEIYPSHCSIEAGTSNTPRPVHLMFKAFDEIRLLKGAYNVAHVAWEYARLPSFDRLPKFHPKRSHPLNDYVYALSLVNEVWVGCTFTRDTLAREGLSNVHVIPAPIDLPEAHGSNRRGSGVSHTSFMHAPMQIVECTRSSIIEGQKEDSATTPGEGLFMRAADCKSRGGKVFLSILNPHDPRKNPGPLIAGFQKYCQKRGRRDILLIKILVDGKYNTLDDVLRVILPRRFRESLCSFDLIDSENIVLFCGTMSELEMDRLYGIADYYLCTSNAEGQNLPLLESMARGVVPISPATTAMADYITDENAILLETTDEPVYESVATAYGLIDARWREVSASEVARGIEQASSHDANQFAAKRDAAIRTVIDRYSPGAIRPLIEQRLAAIEKSRSSGTKNRPAEDMVAYSR